MQILVTGGAGYIGSVVSAELIAAGHEVVVFDNLSQGHRAAVPERATLIVGDLADRAAIERVFEAHSIDAVMHFASRTLVGESMQQPFLYLAENVINCQKLMQIMQSHGVKPINQTTTPKHLDRNKRKTIDKE